MLQDKKPLPLLLGSASRPSSPPSLTLHPCTALQAPHASSHTSTCGPPSAGGWDLPPGARPWLERRRRRRRLRRLSRRASWCCSVVLARCNRCYCVMHFGGSQFSACAVPGQAKENQPQRPPAWPGPTCRCPCPPPPAAATSTGAPPTSYGFSPPSSTTFPPCRWRRGGRGARRACAQRQRQQQWHLRSARRRRASPARRQPLHGWRCGLPQLHAPRTSLSPSQSLGIDARADVSLLLTTFLGTMGAARGRGDAGLVRVCGAGGRAPPGSPLPPPLSVSRSPSDCALPFLLSSPPSPPPKQQRLI